MTKKVATPPPMIVQAAAWPLQLAMIGLIFASLLLSAGAVTLLVEIKLAVDQSAATLVDGIRTRDIKFAQIERRMLEGSDDRYRGKDAARDLAERDARLAKLEAELWQVRRRLINLQKRLGS